MGDKEKEKSTLTGKRDPAPLSSHPILDELRAQIRRKGKIVTGEQAAAIIRDGDVVTTGGFVATGVPEEILVCIEERFKKEGHPRNLTLIYAAGQGDGKDRALNHLGHEGLIGRVIGGHIGLAPMLQKLIREEKILAYSMPQGCISTLFRNLAARKPGLISYVGLGTFIDPRLDGGKLNRKTKKEGEDLVKLMEIEGREILFYSFLPSTWPSSGAQRPTRTATSRWKRRPSRSRCSLRPWRPRTTTVSSSPRSSGSPTSTP
jgi:propionate CoA-transferase